MQRFKFDRNKYIQIMKSEGVETALTRLHNDVNGWEFLAFEGEEGYSPELWENLKEVRSFSRELWDLSLQQEKKEKTTAKIPELG